MSNFERKRKRNEESARQNKENEERNSKREFKGLIIGRSKSQQEIDAQIDQSDEVFRQAEGYEEIHELESEGDQYFEGFADVSPLGEKLDPPIPKCRIGMGGKRNDPQGKEEKDQIP